MLKRILLYGILIFSFKATAQDIFFTSNLTGKHRVTYSESFEALIDIDVQKVFIIHGANTLRIEFMDNSATIVYEFLNVDFDEQDTLRLDFMHYCDIDTTYYTAGCIDGSESEKRRTFLEKNIGWPTIAELPDSIVQIIGNREYLLFKKIEPEIIFSSGNGIK